LISAHTKSIGLGATRSTTYCQPYHIARTFATLDHLSRGRAAWNVVTSVNDSEAANFGQTSHLGHDERYDKAEEFIDICFRLWDSWSSEALILDKATGHYADPAAIHSIDHAGKWYRVKGPLNIPRSPQGRPVIIQAGSSGRGRAFAARWAEVVFTVQPDAARLKSFYADMKLRVKAAGRDPSQCHILPAVMPFIGATEAEAKDKQFLHNELVHPLVGLSTLSSHANYDFAKHALDEPLGEITTTGIQGLVESVLKISHSQRLTLREIGKIYGQSVLTPQLVGTPQQVADQMEAMVRDERCDGFAISPAYLPGSFVEFVDQVVPELQGRGLFRQEFTGTTLREHLRLN
jgi:FMN-dependent oxidoreductase (nitrilotriacetate monooxygenase family)